MSDAANEQTLDDYERELRRLIAERYEIHRHAFEQETAGLRRELEHLANIRPQQPMVFLANAIMAGTIKPEDLKP